MRLIKCAHCKETSKSPSRGVQWGVKNKITLETSFWMLVKGTKSGETWASSSWECGGNFLVLGEKKSDFRQQEHCNRRCLCRHLHLFFYIGNMNNRSFRRIKSRIFLKIFLLNGFLHRIFPWTLQRGVYLLTWVSLIQKQISKYNEYFYSKISKLWLLNLLFLHTQY